MAFALKVGLIVRLVSQATVELPCLACHRNADTYGQEDRVSRAAVDPILDLSCDIKDSENRYRCTARAAMHEGGAADHRQWALVSTGSFK
jgi:hypothetical protein